MHIVSNKCKKTYGNYPKEIIFPVIGCMIQGRMGIRGEGMSNVFPEGLTDEMSFNDMKANTLTAKCVKYECFICEKEGKSFLNCCKKHIIYSLNHH